MRLFRKSQPKPKRKWPEAEPPGDEQNGVRSIGTWINGTPYHKQEVEPGRWQWVVDDESLKRQSEWEQERRDLWWALRTRLLTDEETAKVRRQGAGLNVEPMQSYNATEKALELTDALHKQALLRLALEQKGPANV